MVKEENVCAILITHYSGRINNYTTCFTRAHYSILLSFYQLRNDRFCLVCLFWFTFHSIALCCLLLQTCFQVVFFLLFSHSFCLHSREKEAHSRNNKNMNINYKCNLLEWVRRKKGKQKNSVTLELYKIRENMFVGWFSFRLWKKLWVSTELDKASNPSQYISILYFISFCCYFGSSHASMLLKWWIEFCSRLFSPFLRLILNTHIHCVVRFHFDAFYFYWFSCFTINKKQNFHRCFSPLFHHVLEAKKSYKCFIVL